MARMTAPPPIARTALSGKEWRVLILLVISALINYIDRTTLSVAATDIQRELHLTNTQVGALQSAFFASYALCQLSFVAGWVVGRFHVGWVLACGFFLWSGATAMTGAATVFAMILALRLLLGIGESVSYPSYSRILASEYPERFEAVWQRAPEYVNRASQIFATLSRLSEKFAEDAERRSVANYQRFRDEYAE